MTAIQDLAAQLSALALSDREADETVLLNEVRDCCRWPDRDAFERRVALASQYARAIVSDLARPVARPVIYCCEPDRRT